VIEPADARILEGRRLAKSYAGWAASAGLVPLPLLDVAGLMTTQLAMLRSLTKLYGVPFDRERAKVVLSAAAGSLAPQGVASVAGLSGLKALPGWGGLLGIAVMPALAVASTMAVADWFIDHLAAGGTLADADPRPQRAEPPPSPVPAAEPPARATESSVLAAGATESPRLEVASNAGFQPDSVAAPHPAADEERSESELAAGHGRARRSSRTPRNGRHGDDD